MQIFKTISISTFTAIFLVLAAACNTNSVHAANPIPAQSSARAAAGSTPFAFAESDLAAYEKGLAAETVQVLAARDRGNNAKTPEARAVAAQDEWEEQTIPAGARAAGVSVERYRNVRKTVNHVLETLNYQHKINGPLELDLEHATPEMKQRVTSDAYAGLPPASAAALRTRMNTLLPVWVRYMELVAVNG